MPSVSLVATSNTPTYPGDEGTAPPNPMIPCNNSAPSIGTGSPNARKQTANDAALTSHSTSDQATTPAKREGLRNTASPSTNPSIADRTRTANRCGSSRCAIASSRRSQGAGFTTTITATTSAAPNTIAPTIATWTSDTPPTIASRGNEGAAIATAISPSMVSASNTRSTPIEPSTVVNRTGVRRLSTQARANSPARAGSRLFAMKPIAVASHNAASGSGRPAGSRSSTRHRSARIGKVRVARMTVAASSATLARCTCVMTSVKLTSCNAQARRPTDTARPTIQAQRDRALVGLEGEDNEIADFVEQRTELVGREVPRLLAQLLGARQGTLPAVHQALDIDHVQRGHRGRAWRRGGGRRSGRGARGGERRRG